MDSSNQEKPSIFHDSYISTTRLGTLFGTAIETGFLLIYWLSGYPTPVLVMLIASILISLAGLIIVRVSHYHRLAAHLTILGLYIALIGPGLYTGGIDSSSMTWLVFVPGTAAIMAGAKNSLYWAAISAATLVCIFILNRVLNIDLTLRPTQSIDRFTDLLVVLVTITLMTLLNEDLKKKMVLQLERTQKKLELLSTMDPLTNIYNRRYFFDRAQVELDLSQSNHGQVAILLLDIDHFKRTNDTYGHFVGDQVLCGTVALCGASLRKADILSRFGGEEFIILLPQTNASEAMLIADRIRGVIETTPIKTDSGPLLITVSIGMTVSSIYIPDLLRELIRQADTALYLAKNYGRNQVVRWAPNLYLEETAARAGREKG